MNDEVFHAILDADILYRNTPSDIRCRQCGTRLKAYYCEARLYAVRCDRCKSLTLVKASAPDEAALYVGVSAESYAESQSDKAVMKHYLTSSSELKAEQTGQNTFVVHLSNEKTIEVVEQPTYGKSTFAWKVDTQYFSEDAFALRYLKRLIAEKLTGKRIIYHARRAVCRAPGECNRLLCDGCPVAESFFAQRDGVKLVYATEQKESNEQSTGGKVEKMSKVAEVTRIMSETLEKYCNSIPRKAFISAMERVIETVLAPTFNNAGLPVPGIQIITSPDATTDNLAELLCGACPPFTAECEAVHCDKTDCRDCWQAWLSSGKPSENS